jgi:energy-coupling factor transport system ATP-binding protein
MVSHLMDVQAVKITLNDIRIKRNKWSLIANGTFHEGIHLVSGSVGSGKSTLAMMLAGLIPPVSGKIEQSGIKSCMLSLQFPEYHVTGLTIVQECASWGAVPEDILASTGLTGRAHDSPLSLSRGELKRLHLACVLAKEYDLILLDEPFSSLDCCQKKHLCERISSRQHGITIIFTHEQSILPNVNMIWEIDNGSLFRRGEPPDAILHWRTAPPLIRTLAGSGRLPRNISPEDIQEAACRIRE